MTTTLTPIAPATVMPEEIALQFVAGMPGLEQYSRFTLAGIDDGPVYWLQCDDEPEIALPVANAFAVAPDYSFELSTADADALGLQDAVHALVLTVLTVPAGGAGPITANLLGPVVVNRTTWLAKQVILDGTRHSLRHPLT